MFGPILPNLPAIPPARPLPPPPVAPLHKPCPRPRAPAVTIPPAITVDTISSTPVSPSQVVNAVTVSDILLTAFVKLVQLIPETAVVIALIAGPTAAQSTTFNPETALLKLSLTSDHLIFLMVFCISVKPPPVWSSINPLSRL